MGKLMFIESHTAALSSFKTDIDLYMVDGVVADSEGALSLMLPLARNAITIKFAEDDDIARMVAHAFTMFERFCTSEEAYTFYSDMVASPKVYDRVMKFVTLMLMVDEPLGTLAISKAVKKNTASY